jgi:outer membrane protein TolC
MDRFLFKAALALWLGAWAAGPAAAQADSTLVLSLEAVQTLVLAYHPVAQQAGLLSEKARQEVRMARGEFDPKLEMTQQAKVFKEKEYFTLRNAYLKVPTWWGAEVKAGYERNTGINLGPEQDTDSGKGLGYVGISAPLGPLSRNFLIDARRAALREAQAYQDMAEAERQKTLNKLLYQVAKDYWQWYFAHHQLRLLRNGYRLAEFRFQAVVNEMRQGFMAPIDSVEAHITLQQRDIDIRRAEVELRNAELLLSNHLWDENGDPVELQPGLQPSEASPATLQTLGELESFAMDQHPELVKLRAKQQQLEVGRRLAAENLKPSLTVSYNWLLRRPLGTAESFDMALMSQNYKWGFGVYMPLLLRKERGKLGLAKVKLQENELEQLYRIREISNALQGAYFELSTLSDLLERQEEMVGSYRRLLAGERQKFENGQSSVFYMNVREGKLIEAEVKLFKMRSEYAKSRAQLLWTAGALLP